MLRTASAGLIDSVSAATLARPRPCNARHLALSLGTRLGPYEIVSALGAGGMGEVYRAHDTKLDRDVAIKILPNIFVSDPERVVRFHREARTLASLNHPNIAHIHGLEESGGITALVMEFVEGEDRSQRPTDFMAFANPADTKSRFSNFHGPPGRS
jgi:serine/threonine protein kinase